MISQKPAGGIIIQIMIASSQLKTNSTDEKQINDELV